MFTDYQKRTQLNISRYLLSGYEDDLGDFIGRFVTQHEIWVHHQSQKCRANNGSTLAHPPNKFKRVHSAGKVMAPIYWNSQGVIMIDYLEQGRTINVGIEMVTPGNRKKEARKTDSRCSALAEQRPCPHVTSCHGCCV